MRRTLSAIVLVLLLAPDASAQPIAAGQLARTGAMQAEIAAQASFDTSYLLALYMTQLAAAGAPPSQADIDEAATQYLTNGAAVTGVPSTGPGAEYFRNGAAVTGVPSSGPGATYFHDGAAVMAYPTPRATPAPGATNQAVTGAVASESYEECSRPHRSGRIGRDPRRRGSAAVSRFRVSRPCSAWCSCRA